MNIAILQTNFFLEVQGHSKQSTHIGLMIGLIVDCYLIKKILNLKNN